MRVGAVTSPPNNGIGRFGFTRTAILNLPPIIRAWGGCGTRSRFGGRTDVLRYWSEPADPPGTGDNRAVVAPEPQATDAADGSQRCGTAADSDVRSRMTVGYPELKAAIQKYGQAPELDVIAHAKLTFPEKHVPRAWLRRAIKELWGKPKIGRPKVVR